MRRSAPSFTFDEHRALGHELQITRDSLISLYVRTANAYGKTSKPARLMEKALDSVDALRCEMEEQLFRDHPKDATTHISYRHDRDYDERWPVAREEATT